MTLELITTSFLTYLTDIASYLANANQRVFWLYLLSTIPLGYIGYRQYCIRKAKSQNKAQPSGFLSYLFNPVIWFHPSARHDYAIFLINKVLKLTGLTISLVLMAPIAISLSGDIELLLGKSALLNTPLWLVGISFTFILFILDDFTRFLAHYLLHKIPFLWEFHKVHHSAKVLTPMTIYRSHPVESLLFATRMAGTQGIAVGISYYLFGPTLEMSAIFGANVFVFVFNLMGSNLRHSHVWLSWGDKAEKLFISPAQHQIHHSNLPKHFDTNFGSALAIWDRMFHCYLPASAIHNPHELAFGISRKNTEHQSLVEIYFMPFVLAFGGLIKPLRRLIKRKQV